MRSRVECSLGRLLLAACVVAMSCSPSSDSPPDFVRLVDRFLEPGAVRVEPLRAGFDSGELLASEAFDAIDPNSLLVIESDRLRHLLPGGEPDLETGSARLVETDEGHGLLLQGPIAVLRLVPLEGRGAALRVSLRATGLSAVGSARVFELSRPLTSQHFASDEVLRRELLFGPTSGHVLRPPDAAATPEEYSVTFLCSPGTQALLFATVLAEGRATLDHLDVATLPLDETLALLPGDDFADPRVRRVEVDDDTRESIVLAAPVRFALTTRLPEREPVLRLGAAVVAKAAAGDVRVEIEVHPTTPGPEAQSVRLEFDGASGSWHDTSLDLSRLAGLDCTITVTADRPAAAAAEVGQGAPFGIAIGAPVVEGLPADVASLPNDVVLISLDTVRADRLALYGAERDTSPNLQELARTAVVFENAIAPSNWTLTSHASIFTGQLPERHGVTAPDRRISRQSGPLLAESFRVAGYETVAVTASGFVHPEFGFARGFERYGTREIAQVDVETSYERRHRPSAAERTWLLDLLKRPRRRPLFLFVHTYSAHDYLAAQQDLRAVGVEESELEQIPIGFDGFDEIEKFEEPPDRAEDAAVERVRLLYDATLRNADRVVGDVVGALQAAGQLDRTLLIVFSDHGEELYERGRFGHGGYLTEELIRVPLLVRMPGLAGRSESQVVSLVDLAPTVRALSGFSDGPPTDGRSLKELLESGSLGSMPAIAQAVGRTALRSERLKLLVVDERAGRPEASPTGTPAPSPDDRLGSHVFDLAVDPRENRDLASERGDLVIELVESLNHRLEAARRSPADPTEEIMSAARREELQELGYFGEH